MNLDTSPASRTLPLPLHTAVLSKETPHADRLHWSARPSRGPDDRRGPAARVRVNFPLNKWTGTADSAVVYFEVAPASTSRAHRQRRGGPLHRHRHGRGRCGDERGRVNAGDLAVIPAMVPHGIVNDGDETLRVVGFFSSPRSSRRSRSRSSRSASPRSRWAHRFPPEAGEGEWEPIGVLPALHLRLAGAWRPPAACRHEDRTHRHNASPCHRRRCRRPGRRLGR